MTLYLILYIFGFICFLIAAIGHPVVTGWNPVAAGLAFWILVPLITIVRSML